MRQPTVNRRQTGFSLIEGMVCVAVAGTLLAVSLPSAASFIERQRSQGQASRFLTDFQQARMQSLASRSAVHVRFAEHAQGSCYTMHQGPKDACTCSETGEAACTPAGQLLSTEWLPAAGGVRLSANVSRMTLNGGNLTVTPTGTVRVLNRAGQGSAHVVAITGRVRSSVLN